MARAGARILREEGVLAFWKGNTAAVMRVVPYMSITFLSYEEFRARLQDAGLQKQAATLAGGLLAGVTAVALTYPLDLARATMAMPGTPYTSMADALARTAREHGIGAWYRGMGSTIVGVAPYNALKFGAYEALKALVGGVFGRDEATLRPWQRVGAGALAGLVAQTAVYPLDVVRRRSQTHRGATPLYSSPGPRAAHDRRRGGDRARALPRADDQLAEDGAERRDLHEPVRHREDVAGGRE